MAGIAACIAFLMRRIGVRCNRMLTGTPGTCKNKSSKKKRDEFFAHSYITRKGSGKLRKKMGQSRNYRHKAGWSQEKLAEHADVHRNYISRIESGLIDLSVSGLAKIAKGLRVSMNDLIEEKTKLK